MPIIVRSQQEYRALSSLRRRPEVPAVKAIIERELADARATNERNAADEANRATVVAYRDVLAALLTDPIEVATDA